MQPIIGIDNTGDIVPTGQQMQQQLLQVNLIQKNLFLPQLHNPQYKKWLFIDSPVQYIKLLSWELVVYINSSEYQNKKQFVYTQYGPIKNSRIKNQHSDFEKN